MPPIGERFDYPKITHYYGDAVRALFVGCAALMLIASPLFVDDLASDIILLIPGSIALVALAALTNPWKQWLMTANAIAAGVGCVIFALWAILEFDSSTSIAFLLRSLIAICFLLAFYFALKTVRAMMTNQIGHRDRLSDFDTEEDEKPDSENTYDDIAEKEWVDREANAERVREDSD